MTESHYVKILRWTQLMWSESLIAYIRQTVVMIDVKNHVFDVVLLTAICPIYFFI